MIRLLRGFKSKHGYLTLVLEVDGEEVPYVYSADDPYRMAGLDELIEGLEFPDEPEVEEPHEAAHIQAAQIA